MNASAADTHRRVVWPITLAALAVLAVIMAVLATHWGVGTSPDSAGYVSIARSVLAGDGYRDLYGNPAAIWPPGYPLLLALLGLPGVDPLVVARWLNALLFGANVVLVGLILRRCVRTAWLAALGALLVLTSVDMLTIHAMAWSEPLFICLSLVGVLWIAAYARRPTRRRVLAAAAAVALATLTRYAGLAIVAAGGLVILCSTSQPIRRRLVDTVLFGAVACLPIAAWAVRNAIVAGSSTARTLLFHPFTSRHAHAVIETTSLWLLPTWIPYGVRAVILVGAVVGLAVLAYATARSRRDPAPADAPPLQLHLPRVLGLFLLMYALLLTVSVSFLDKYTTLRLRGMAPAFPPALVLVLCLADRLIARRPRRYVRPVVAAVCVLFALWYANRAFWRVHWLHNEGLRFSSRPWRESPLIEQVDKLDPGVTIYTNAVDAVYFRAQRPARQIPARRLTAQHGYRQNERFAQDLAELHSRLEAHGGVIVFFTGEKMRGRGYLASQDDLTTAIPLRVRTQTDDGIIYELDQ